jgi:AAA15 family ATPase/GTPase
MIIQFNFINFKTFKDPVSLSMIASNYDKDTNEDDNIIKVENQNLRILKSSVMFGANASGKSKFIEAITFFRQFILESSKDSLKGQRIPVEPFRLNERTAEEPSEFEIIFILDGTLYRYGFETNSKAIVAEWLFARLKKKEVQLFYRNGQMFDIDIKRVSKAKLLITEALIRENALLLSVLAQFNDNMAISILDYFSSMKCISGLNEFDYKNNSIRKVRDDAKKKKEIVDLLKSADFGIEDIGYEDVLEYVDETNKDFVHFKGLVSKFDADDLSNIRTKHRVYNDQNRQTGYIDFLMSDDESHGTQKYFYFAGLILDALELGTNIIIDEMDSKLHPNLVCRIVSLFNSKTTNPRNAQLIFNTHDSNLLSSGIFRRDQIWFVSKNEYGASKIYSLADFKTDAVRKKEPFEENYIRGKYGAVPFLGEFETITDKILGQYGEAK